MLTTDQQEFLRSILTRVRGRAVAPTREARSQPPAMGEVRSSAAPDGRDPSLLGGAIGRLVVSKGWDLSLAAGALHGRWPELVGADVAAHVAIVAFDLDPGSGSGVLVLAADSTAWATQMRLMTAVLHTRLEEELGAGRISEIVVNGPAAPTWKHGSRTVRGRGPRDTYG
jgi:predicted nucleic acid-binding Zn ribbon protein